MVHEPGDVQRAAARVLSVVMIGLGVAILVTTIGRGGGPFTVGVVMAVLLVAAGCARLWAESRRA